MIVGKGRKWKRLPVGLHIYITCNNLNRKTQKKKWYWQNQHQSLPHFGSWGKQQKENMWRCHCQPHHECQNPNRWKLIKQKPSECCFVRSTVWFSEIEWASDLNLGRKGLIWGSVNTVYRWSPPHRSKARVLPFLKIALTNLVRSPGVLPKIKIK